MNNWECLAITDLNFQHFEVLSTLDSPLQGLDFLERLFCTSKSAFLMLHADPALATLQCESSLSDINVWEVFPRYA